MSHGLDVLQHDEHRDIIGFQLQFAGPLIRASRTGAVQSQISNRIDALVAIAPRDAEHALLKPLHVFRLNGFRAHGSINFEFLIVDC